MDVLVVRDNSDAANIAFEYLLSRMHIHSESNEAVRFLQSLFIHTDLVCGPENCFTFDQNNGISEKYPQPTPKQRIQAALHDKLKEVL